MCAGQATAGKNYSAANSLSTQAIVNIRTIVAFGSEEKAHNTYSSLLDKSVRIGTQIGTYQGLAGGAVNFVMYSTYAYFLLVDRVESMSE
jgi:ATP-binding cassette subfamily B (MDR/TAP) protein 1